MTLTLAELLPAAAGLLLSLLFGFAPKVSDWYDTLTDKHRAVVMLIALLLTSIVIVAASCTGIVSTYLPSVACDRLGITSVVDAFIRAGVVNQSTYFLTRKLK